MTTYSYGEIVGRTLTLRTDNDSKSVAILASSIESIRQDWDTGSGSLLITTISGDQHKVVFDSGDNGVECADFHTAAFNLIETNQQPQGENHE